jgi:hypothetical protein
VVAAELKATHVRLQYCFQVFVVESLLIERLRSLDSFNILRSYHYLFHTEVSSNEYRNTKFEHPVDNSTF